MKPVMLWLGGSALVLGGSLLLRLAGVNPGSIVSGALLVLTLTFIWRVCRA